MRRLIPILLAIVLPFLSQGQDGSLIANMKTAHVNSEIKDSFAGLWGVVEVKVGNENLTPVAKWFQFNEDGTATGGNGWVQNSASTWAFDEVANEILFSNDGIPDEYGAFLLQLNEKQMTWSRIEDDEQVTVTLIRIDKKPLAPWDKVVGVWEWIGMETLNLETNVVITADVEPDWTRIRWDRRYITVDASGKRTKSGIWHIDAHQPTLTVIDDKGERFLWQIEFKDDHMVWIGEKDGEKTTLIFEKTNSIGN